MAERTNGATVIYVDDDPNDRLLLQEAAGIANVPFTFQNLASFDAAMAYLSGSGVFSDRSRYPVPGLIILDYNLKTQTGADLLRWIRTRPELSTVPVVIYTGAPSPERVSDCYASGASHFFTKPLQLPRIIAIVEELYELMGSDSSSIASLRDMPEYHAPPASGASPPGRNDGGIPL